ncbi:MAG TPA: response regulator [Candidatus Binatia bacterium]|jgi:CheY-like chemotaxis protein|nr:response regulator [Candidatus Binatia bacterium]
MANKQKILLVEDNSDFRELLAIVLRRSGYEVAEAATGLTAVEQASATHPDLILMDLGLPGITGDEATARLKADPSTRDIPVIINTAFHKGALVERAIAAGAAEILHKPISFEALQEVVRRYLSSDYPFNGSHSRTNPQVLRSDQTTLSASKQVSI